MTTASSVQTQTPLAYHATSTEAAFIKGYANALGITCNEAFTRFVRSAMGCGYTSKKRFASANGCGYTKKKVN
jgi:hypothetical protein